MKKWQQGLAAGLAAMVLVSSSAVGLADERDDKLKEAAEQLQKMNEASSRVDTISEQLRQMQGEVDEATSEYKRVKGNLDEVQGRIDENKVLLDKTEKELKAKSKVLDKRVRDIYINGQISYIDVLFGAKDFSDFMTRMDLLKRIKEIEKETLEANNTSVDAEDGPLCGVIICITIVRDGNPQVRRFTFF